MDDAALGEERSVTPLHDFRRGYKTAPLSLQIRICTLLYSQSLAFLPLGSLLKGFPCLSSWLLQLHSRSTAHVGTRAELL